MAEEMIKVRVEDLTTIRLVFRSGAIHEIPVEQAADYAVECHDGGTKQRLHALGDALSYFSRYKTEPSIEFAVPMKARGQ